MQRPTTPIDAELDEQVQTQHDARALLSLFDKTSSNIDTSAHVGALVRLLSHMSDPSAAIAALGGDLRSSSLEARLGILDKIFACQKAVLASQDLSDSARFALVKRFNEWASIVIVTAQQSLDLSLELVPDNVGAYKPLADLVHVAKNDLVQRWDSEGLGLTKMLSNRKQQQQQQQQQLQQQQPLAQVRHTCNLQVTLPDLIRYVKGKGKIPTEKINRMEELVRQLQHKEIQLSRPEYLRKISDIAGNDAPTLSYALKEMCFVMSRKEIMLKFAIGDPVEALDPTNGKWVRARIHKLHDTGNQLGRVEVKWDKPGKYQPIGEVWAEQIREPKWDNKRKRN